MCICMLCGGSGFSRPNVLRPQMFFQNAKLSEAKATKKRNDTAGLLCFAPINQKIKHKVTFTMEYISWTYGL